MSVQEITRELAEKVLGVVDAGLVSGVGVPEPGKMCVEAAVCYAMGEPHGDEPTCVAPAVRCFKIGINDSPWSTPQARAKGLRRIAIAQLGSRGIDEQKFTSYVAEQLIRRVVPLALEAAARVHPDEKHKQALNTAADVCRKEGTEKAAYSAARSAAYSAACSAAGSAACSAAGSAADEVLSLAAEIGVEALVICGAEGVKFLSVTESK